MISKSLAVASLLYGHVAAADPKDLVDSLPDFGKPKTNTYSGFLNATATK